jgi:hypothetical protein
MDYFNTMAASRVGVIQNDLPAKLLQSGSPAGGRWYFKFFKKE